MYYLKPLSLLLIVLLSGFNLLNNKPVVAKWVITRECSLKVNGSTNINEFACIIPEYKGPDTLTLYKGTDPVKMSGSLALDVTTFDCHNRGMTGELRKVLKAKEFPNLIIRFISIDKYPDHMEPVKGIVTIELAGVSKRFEVDYRFIPDGPHMLTLVGTKQVNFSDFNITPPTKLGGIIKTKNELNVEFDLKVKVLE